MDSKNQSNVYEHTWHPEIEAVLNENTSKFFRDYLQYKTASSIKVVSDNNTKEVYQLFKNFVNAEFKTHGDFINDIVRYTNWYKWIISGIVTIPLSTDKIANNQIEELIKNIFHDIKSEAFKPFALGLLEYHQSNVNDVKLSDDLLISILRTIRTYLIRRRIIGLTKAENQNIVLLSNRIEDLAKDNITMTGLLSNMFYGMRFPNDNEMSKEIETMNFYEGLSKYSKFILGKIEEHNTKVAVDYRNPKITIEHIMPRKTDKNWESELGKKFEHIHKTYLHNIGNLILTEFNSEMGNKSFSDKKIKLKTSSLNYRLHIIDKNSWNKKSIEEHQKNMISWLLETFPLPDDYKEKDNWNTKIIENTDFSPLDNDAGDMAESNKPIEVNVENNIVKVSTWQDVFIEFIKYIKNNKDYDFEIILDNQFKLFGKDNAILKWTELESLIEDNIEKLRNRYKTFEGKFWDNVKYLTDDTYFVHINFSASTCVNRIANIMNKFNMSKNTVNIKIK